MKDALAFLTNARFVGRHNATTAGMAGTIQAPN